MSLHSIDQPVAPISPEGAGNIIALAMRIANRAVVTDIECGAHCVDIGDGLRWWDIRPMLDDREHCSESIDMAAEAIAYALDSGVVLQHPVHSTYLRIAPGALL